MYAAAAISFRESVEAGLVVGVLLALTRGAAWRGLATGLGVMAGILASAVVALALERVLKFPALASSDLFKALVTCSAVVMVIWHQVASRRGLGADFDPTRQATGAGPALALLSLLVAVAVFREGCEAILFLAGLASEQPASQQPSLLAGVAAGLALSALVTSLTYAGLVRLPGHLGFVAANATIITVAAGMASRTVGLLERAGVVPPLGSAWDVSALVPESSPLGLGLHALIGYSARPDWLQVAAFLGVLGLIPVLLTQRTALADAPSGRVVRFPKRPSAVDRLLSPGQMRAEMVFLAIILLAWLVLLD